MSLPRGMVGGRAHICKVHAPNYRAIFPVPGDQSLNCSTVKRASTVGKVLALLVADPQA